jgi:hypothetical protein
MVHTAHEEFSLSSQDCVPSLKPTRHDPFAIICKATKQTKLENKFFNAVESLRR